VGVVELSEYLAAMALRGDRDRLAAIEMFGEGASPSEAAAATGLSKDVVRGIVRRAYEKLGTTRARRLLAVLAREAMRIEPVVRRRNGASVICGICGEEVSLSWFPRHLRDRHPSVLESAVRRLVSAAPIIYNSTGARRPGEPRWPRQP